MNLPIPPEEITLDRGLGVESALKFDIRHIRQVCKLEFDFDLRRTAFSRDSRKYYMYVRVFRCLITGAGMRDIRRTHAVGCRQTFPGVASS